MRVTTGPVVTVRLVFACVRPADAKQSMHCDTEHGCIEVTHRRGQFTWFRVGLFSPLLRLVTTFTRGGPQRRGAHSESGRLTVGPDIHAVSSATQMGSQVTVGLRGKRTLRLENSNIPRKRVEARRCWLGVWLWTSVGATQRTSTRLPPVAPTKRGRPTTDGDSDQMWDTAWRSTVAIVGSMAWCGGPHQNVSMSMGRTSNTRVLQRPLERLGLVTGKWRSGCTGSATGVSVGSEYGRKRDVFVMRALHVSALVGKTLDRAARLCTSDLAEELV